METKFVQSSFTDFRGVEHQFTVAGVVISYQKNSPAILFYDEDLDTNEFIGSDVYKILSIGISICNPGDGTETNPGDKFNAITGKKQSEGRAIKYMDRLIAFNKGGMVDDDTVTYFIEKTAMNLKNNPGLFIKGYNSAAKKYQDTLANAKSLPTDTKSPDSLLCRSNDISIL